MIATTPRAAESSGFRPDIQGLRAVAVLAVVLYHAGVPFLPGGYVGVDVFFVISGFLITSHLWRRLERDGRIGFAEFSARRARRILPASFVVLLATVAAAALWYPPLLMPELWRSAVATALYVPNYLFAVEGTDYLAESTPSLLQHYWSLGVEEQFYLVWPALLALGWVVLRSRRALAAVLAVLAGLSFAACLVLTVHSQPWAFFSLPTRAWEFAAGGLVAVALARRGPLLPPRAAAVTGWVGLAAVLAAVVLYTSATSFPGVAAALPVAGTAAVILAGATPHRSGPSLALGVRPMQFLGAISYSLYLVHWPALMLPETAVTGALPMWATMLIAAACVPAAWLLFRFVENPLRGAPGLTRARPRRTLLAAAAGSLVCVLAASGVSAAAATRELSTGERVTTAALQAPPEATPFVPANLEPSLRTAEQSLPEIFADGCNRGVASVDTDGCRYGDEDAPRIVLFGDSHAAHWFPAVLAAAEEAGMAVEVQTKSGCPVADLAVERDGSGYPECDAWRAGVIERIGEQRPALVLAAEYGGTPLAAGLSDDAATWDAALGATLDALEVPVAVLADTPDLRESPSVCLSLRLGDAISCGKDRAEALAGPAREAEVSATAERGIPLIDLNDYLCDARSCAPILGDTLVYRDSHHMTAVFSARLAEPLGAALRAHFPSLG